MIRVSAIQMKMGNDKKMNLAKAEELVREAAKDGSKIILLPELFEGLYFCKDKDNKYFSWASEREKSMTIEKFSLLAKELGVVLPISYFEKSNHDYFNSLVVIDADGTVMQNYRKTHIPDGPGYEEKFYFKSGDTGFKVWDTTYAKIGVGICWDQWFPESARIMALMGAELIFYPTAIGSEPEINIDSKEHWQRVQMGHAAANTIPVIVANRTGIEIGKSCTLTFYGSSFMTDYTGKKVIEASRNEEIVISTVYNLEENSLQKDYWALFKDRQPSKYKLLTD